MQLVDSGTGQIIAREAWYARTFWARFLGLMGRRDFPEGVALVLEPCSMVHTFFMKFPIDVYYLDSQGRVIKCIRNLRPWRVGPWVRRAKKVAEMKSKEMRFGGVRHEN